MVYKTREEWLGAASKELRKDFAAKGFTVPALVRFSCGFPQGSKKAIGQAWSSMSSKDKHFEIFVSPSQDRADRVLDILLHEMVHVTVGLEAGHKGAFSVCARSMGLEGKMTATVASAPLSARLKDLAAKLGKYPHASLNKMTNGRKKQTTRLIKAHCLGCTFTIRLTMSWVLIGLPCCPNPDCHYFGRPFELDVPAADPDEGEGD